MAQRSSQQHAEYVVVNIESSTAIGTNVEHLRKPEFIGTVHPQVTWHEDQHTAG